MKSSTVFGPYSEQIVIFRKIISAPLVNKPKICVTQKKFIFSIGKNQLFDFVFVSSALQQPPG